MLKKSPKKKPVPSAKRMSAYRARMRKAGLKQVQLWLYDTKSPAFIKAAREQSLAVARQDAADDDMDTRLEAAFDSLET
jgi:hypothetical protein